MNKTFNKITIINTVPINGGDEALLIATTSGLRQYFDRPIINVLCYDPYLCRKTIKNEALDWDWEYAFKKADRDENVWIFRLKLRIREYLNRSFNVSYFSQISRWFSSKREQRVYKILNDSDMIILGAGGYIHDFYGYNKRIDTLSFIRDTLKKPYYFFSQSVGPFWKEDKYTSLKRAFDGASKIILREYYSLNHLKHIEYHCENVVVSNDIAFYLFYKYAKKVDLNKKLNKVAVNFREWQFEKESSNNVSKAKTLCENLIDQGYEITFLSTCQGVTGYHDDSVFAKKIVNLLTPDYKRQCTILDRKYSIDDLMDILSNQDAYIGMRLHGAILSMLAGIPALGIAYEDKTLGIYETLGIEDYCFCYKESLDTWKKKTEEFIQDYDFYLNKVEQIVEQAAESVKQNFELLLNKNGR